MTKCDAVICIEDFDLEKAERNATRKRDRLAKTGSGKTPYLFSISP